MPCVSCIVFSVVFLQAPYLPGPVLPKLKQPCTMYAAFCPTCALHCRRQGAKPLPRMFSRAVRSCCFSATPVDRKCVVKGRSGSVRVDIGGRRVMKKTNIGI